MEVRNRKAHLRHQGDVFFIAMVKINRFVARVELVVTQRKTLFLTDLTARRFAPWGIISTSLVLCRFTVSTFTWLAGKRAPHKKSLWKNRHSYLAFNFMLLLRCSVPVRSAGRALFQLVFDGISSNPKSRVRTNDSTTASPITPKPRRWSSGWPGQRMSWWTSPGAAIEWLARPAMPADDREIKAADQARNQRTFQTHRHAYRAVQEIPP